MHRRIPRDIDVVGCMKCLCLAVYLAGNVRSLFYNILLL